MRDVTIALVHFKAVTLAHLEASLFSVRMLAGLESVRELVVVDNDTVDSEADILATIAALDFPIQTRLVWSKHGDPSRTHAWSTNEAVRQARAPWVLMTRADYLLHADLLVEMRAAVAQGGDDWDGVVVPDGYHLASDLAACEAVSWRRDGLDVLRALPGVAYDHGIVDSGVWMARRATCERVGGLDERLTAWGHAQTEFQHRLHLAGVPFARVSRVLVHHPRHDGERDLALAHAQLAERGVDVRAPWVRYHGKAPY